MPYTRRFGITGAPDDARPWRNWHPYVGIPLTLLGSVTVAAPTFSAAVFPLSFLSAGLAIVCWWVGSCYAHSDRWRLILFLTTQTLALVALICWGILLIQEFRRGG